VSRGQRLTTTSYAILGLLGIRSWTTHQLTQQMDRSLGRLWPRAASKLYEEPKKLVALGLAKATADPVGNRPRTAYTITPKGRRALAAWLAEPGAGPVLEFEGLLKIFFAEHGTRDNALASIAAARAWALERNEANLAVARAYTHGNGPFQERVAITGIMGRFLTDYYAMVNDWADWAEDVVSSWPDDPDAASVNNVELHETVRRAERIAGAK
jgi:PadR family transcriptional regulator, regulatory protein AphA